MNFPLPTSVVYDIAQLQSPVSEGWQNFVFFDDLIYTGSQMSQTIKTIVRQMRYKKPQNFHVIAACVPEYSVLDTVSIEPREIIIHKGCTIQPTITKTLQKPEAFAVYAQHKLPDLVSCYDKEIAKIIRNCDATKTGGFAMNPCPIVPYKQEDGIGPDLNRWFK
jgi:hypothetical protein